MLGFRGEEWRDYCAIGSVTIQPLSGMSVIRTYYDIPKVLLNSIGLWPYDRPKFVIIQNVCSVLVAISCILPQFFVFVTTKITLRLALKSLSPIIMSCGAILHYVMFWYQNDTFRQFLKEVEHDWQMKDKEAREILKKNTEIGRQHAKFYTAFVYPSAAILVVLDISNYVSHVIAPSNGTHVFDFPIMMEYFIDERDHFLLVTIHHLMSIFVISTIYASTESLHIMFLQHTAGLFATTSNLIERAVVRSVANCKSNNRFSANSGKAIFVAAVNMHRRALSFGTMITENGRPLYSILIILGILSLSASFYRLSLSILDPAQIEESLTALIFSFSVLAYMFYLNYMVQQMVDRATDIVPLLYETPWYDTSIGVQKLLLILMIKANRGFSLVYYHSLQTSIEGFSTMLKKSVSGLMIMISLQER